MAAAILGDEILVTVRELGALLLVAGGVVVADGDATTLWSLSQCRELGRVGTGWVAGWGGLRSDPHRHLRTTGLSARARSRGASPTEARHAPPYTWRPCMGSLKTGMPREPSL